MFLLRFASTFAAVAAALSVSCKEAPAPAQAELPAAVAAAPSGSASAAPKAVPPVAAPKTRPEGRTYNVVLIMIDSLRADMPWAGYPRPIAPWLTRFAERSTLYPRSYALSSYTAKSVVPALVGKYPGELGRDGYFFTVWTPDNLFISERAQAEGHRTLAGHGHGYFLPALGANQGFDDYQLLPGTHLELTGVSDVTSEALNGLAKKMLSDPKNTTLASGKRFFGYFHFLDPHFTYIKHEGHPDFGNERRDLYDNEVHFSDRWVGDLVDFIDAQPFGKDTAVIITADHGEGFGEHDHFRHAYQVWESLVRVPLFVRVPGAEPRRIETPRSAIDLAPTIADLMGLSERSDFRGESLVPEVFGAPAKQRQVLVDLPRSDLMDRRRAFVDGDYKLISFGDDWSLELYKVTEDFKEERELSKAEPEKLADMKRNYLAFTAKIPNVPVVGSAPLKGARPGQRW